MNAMDSAETTSPRLALFVLEALPNAQAVRRFVVDHAADIAFVGLSNAERPNAGGFFGQLWRHLKRSGPGILPYLAVNFGIPDVLRPLFPLLSRLAARPLPATAIPLEILCRERGVATLRIDAVNGPEVARAFAEAKPDLIVAFHFDQIFSSATLALAPLGGVNVHPGLLPRHRGPVPTIHALTDEPPDFGVTIHRLAATIDAGAILAQEAAALPEGTSATAASTLLHERGRVLLDGVLAGIARDGMRAGDTVAPLPYCPFPDRRLLHGLRRKRRRLTDWHDFREALALTGIRRR